MDAKLTFGYMKNILRDCMGPVGEEYLKKYYKIELKRSLMTLEGPTAMTAEQVDAAIEAINNTIAADAPSASAPAATAPSPSAGATVATAVVATAEATVDGGADGGAPADPHSSSSSSDSDSSDSSNGSQSGAPTKKRKVEDLPAAAATIELAANTEETP